VFRTLDLSLSSGGKGKEGLIVLGHLHITSIRPCTEEEISPRRQLRV